MVRNQSDFDSTRGKNGSSVPQAAVMARFVPPSAQAVQKSTVSRMKYGFVTRVAGQKMVAEVLPGITYYRSYSLSIFFQESPAKAFMRINSSRLSFSVAGSRTHVRKSFNLV